MTSDERRRQLANTLEKSEEPIKGTELANLFNVSRQVIVQDIALLRAQGAKIIATPQGYMILQRSSNKLIKSIVCHHEGYKAMEKELDMMIQHGAKIIDVIVEHPLYGEIKSMLNISHEKDLEYFMTKVKDEKAEPLANLTGGIHIHTIEITNEKAFEALKKNLKEQGYLIEG